jgi:hypothetical protein
VSYRTGIILKKYFTHQQKIALLDREYGRSEYAVASQQACVGALVEYRLRTYHRFDSIDTMEIVALPLQLACHDLLFFHQLLELCYYFIPSGLGSTEFFDFIAYIYTLTGPVPYRSKQLFLIKFFVDLGIYPESPDEIVQLFHRTAASVPIDILIDLDLNLGGEDEIKTWLRRCIALHPQAGFFKTIHF